MDNTAKKETAPMTLESPLAKENVINAFCEGLRDTLHLMAQVDVTFEKPDIRLSWETEGDITGCIDFSTTDFKGSIYIHFPSDVLVKLYNQMVGENYTEVCPEILDCIGEISNMAYGVAKGKLDPLQLKFSMSLPKPVKTVDLQRLPLPHLAIPFLAYDKRCLLEITLVKA